MLELNPCCAYGNAYTLLNCEMTFRMGQKGVEFLTATVQGIADSSGCAGGNVSHMGKSHHHGLESFVKDGN